jgi:glycosyltransferase involved in cell wall biosynthesis
LHYIRIWDAGAAGRVDAYIANSRFVARRIERIYGKTASVVYPPVELERFRPGLKRGEHYLVVGRMVPYKRTDLAVVACTRLGLPLKVVGDGPELDRLKRLAGPTVEFLGRLTDERVALEMGSARALLFCGEEDFGITPVEAQAAGTPVIAYGRGGALETVAPPDGEDASGATGLFFRDPTAESLAEALLRFDAISYRLNPAVAQAHAAGFSTERYIREMRTVIAERWEAFVGRR